MGAAVLGGVFWFVIARLLDVESYGQISYYISIGSILAVIGSLGLGTALTTFVAKGEKDFALHANSLALLIGLVSGVLVSFIDVSLGLFVAASIFFNMSVSYFLGRRRYQVYSGVALGARALQLVLSVALFVVLGFQGIILGYALAMLLFSFGFLYSLRRFRLKFEAVLNHKNFVAHTYGTNLLQVSSMYLDKIVIGSIFGFGLLGIYTISSQFLLLLATLPGALFQYLLPQNSAGLSTLKIKRTSLLGAFVLSIVGLLGAPIVISTFFPDYSDSIPLAQVMMLALVPYTFTVIARAEFFAKERSRNVLQGMSIFILGLVVVQITLGSLIGSVGLAFAIVTAYGLEATYLWSSRRRNSTSISNDPLSAMTGKSMVKE